MTKSIFGGQDEKLGAYLYKTFQPEDAILQEIRERSQKEGLPKIQLGAMDALHIEVLTRASKAKKAVEIGTLGGYSGVSILRGLSGGTLYTFEMSKKYAEVARESFEKAGFKNQVKQFVGPALENLSKIENEGPFDLVFIDADKSNYPNYLEWAEKNLTSGGVVLGDNTLAFGMIADTEFESEQDKRTVTGLQRFNDAISHSGKFRSTMIPTGEGLTMGVRV